MQTNPAELVAFEDGASFDPYRPPPRPRDLCSVSNWALLLELYPDRGAVVEQPTPEASDAVPLFSESGDARVERAAVGVPGASLTRGDTK